MLKSFLLGLLWCGCATTAAAMDPMEVASKVASRPVNDGRVGTMIFKMVNASGQERNRAALMAHTQDADAERIAIYFTKPASIEETAFLSYDHEGDKTDENWLYMPATQRVRRLPASERGDYFLGTDLTFGDIKDNFKFHLADWTFDKVTETSDGGKSCFELTGTASSVDTQNEMGYSRFIAKVDPSSWFPYDITYFDAEGEKLKTVKVTRIDKVGETWTALRFEAEQHQTGHRTYVHFEDMRAVPSLDDAVFDPDALSYGVPDIES